MHAWQCSQTSMSTSASSSHAETTGRQLLEMLTRRTKSKKVSGMAATKMESLHVGKFTGRRRAGCNFGIPIRASRCTSFRGRHTKIICFLFSFEELSEISSKTNLRVELSEISSKPNLLSVLTNKKMKTAAFICASLQRDGQHPACPPPLPRPSHRIAPETATNENQPTSKPT